MKRAPRTFLAVAAGYTLGRGRPMKLALVAGGVLLGRHLAGQDQERDEHASDQGESLSSGAGQLTGAFRDRLLSAARTAAVTAASEGIDSLGDNLTERANSIRGRRADTSGTDNGTDEGTDNGTDEGTDEGTDNSADEVGDDADDASGSSGRSRKTSSSKASSSKAGDAKANEAEANESKAGDAKANEAEANESRRSRARSPRKPRAPRSPDTGGGR
ncbi:hypothetical protein HQ32_02165 [Prauserella sp. Am3]|nr:hypothetical protein HQ32_02165 [Prauserella sp. Am3]